MARTIGRHRPRNSPKSDFETLCSYCGIAYLRSQLRKDRSGNLACADDYGGDVVSLTEANAAAAQRIRIGAARPMDSGGYDHSADPDPQNPNPPAYPRTP